MTDISRRDALRTIVTAASGAAVAGCTEPVALDMPSSELVGGPDDLQSEQTVYMYAPDNGGEAGNRGIPYMFRPMVAFIEQGTTVRWTHAGSGLVLHSSTAFGGTSTDPLLIPTDARAWNSGPFAARKDPFRHTFGTPGVYVYYCMPHQDFGMAGILVVGDVGPGDPGWSPGMTEPIGQESPLSPEMTDKIAMLREMVRKRYETGGQADPPAERIDGTGEQLDGTGERVDRSGERVNEGIGGDRSGGDRS